MNGEFNSKTDTMSHFFSKTRTLYSIFQKGMRGLPSSPSCTPVTGTKYASISLNMLKYPRKCLLNKPGLSGWHSWICKGYAYFRICLIMAPYASIMSEYASRGLNIPQYALLIMFLDMPENAWINCSECAMVLSLPQ